jgi:hypothetical protein
MGDLTWGISDFPALARLNGSLQNEKANAGGDCLEPIDPNLRSTQAVHGYDIQASDGTIGHVNDFIVDDESWAIRRLVAETGHWLSGKLVLIPLSQIDGISYKEVQGLREINKGSHPERAGILRSSGRHRRSRFFAAWLVMSKPSAQQRSRF